MMISGDALVAEADVTDQAQAVAAVERTVAEFGRLDWSTMPA
jgi:NAD(P)-dependent dehydrogenase (short-subunit alcohol dehydrogenase family)